MASYSDTQEFGGSGKTALIFVLGLSAAVFCLMFLLVQGQTQEGVVQYLDKELEGQGIPLYSVTVVQDEPLHVRVTLQSTSEGTDVAVEDADFVQKAQRIVNKARDNGYEVENLVIAIVNQQGEQIFLLETPIPQKNA